MVSVYRGRITGTLPADGSDPSSIRDIRKYYEFQLINDGTVRDVNVWRFKGIGEGMRFRRQHWPGKYLVGKFAVKLDGRTSTANSSTNRCHHQALLWKDLNLHEGNQDRSHSDDVATSVPPL